MTADQWAATVAVPALDEGKLRTRLAHVIRKAVEEREREMLQQHRRELAALHAAMSPEQRALAGLLAEVLGELARLREAVEGKP